MAGGRREGSRSCGSNRVLVPWGSGWKGSHQGRGRNWGGSGEGHARAAVRSDASYCLGRGPEPTGVSEGSAQAGSGGFTFTLFSGDQ